MSILNQVGLPCKIIYTCDLWLNYASEAINEQLCAIESNMRSLYLMHGCIMITTDPPSVQTV